MCNDWKRQGIMETTLSWYKENAPLYAEETKNSLVYDALGEFLSRVEEKGRILDLGCGSGRDSFFFGRSRTGKSQQNHVEKQRPVWDAGGYMFAALPCLAPCLVRHARQPGSASEKCALHCGNRGNSALYRR